MSILKKLASDTAVYGISTMLGRFLNYLLVALHTKLFVADELAVQVQLYAYAGLSLVLYTFGMETAFFRFARKEADRQQYYNLILSAVILVSAIGSGLMMLNADQIADYIHYPEHTRLIKWFAIIMAIDAIVSIPFARLRLEGKGKKFVGIRVANILITIFLNLFFLLVCRDISQEKYLSALKPFIDLFYDPNRAPDYIILANLIANGLFLWMLRKELADFRFVFNRQLFKPVWVYAFPIMIMNAAAVVNMLFDRSIMQFLLPRNFYPGRTTKEAIGIYGQCYKLSIFMNLAIQAFKYAAEPFFFSKGEDKNAPIVFARIMKYFIIICVIMWVGIALNLDLLASLFLKRKMYHEALPIVPWLLAGFLFLGIYYNLATWFKLTDKTQYGTYLTLTGAAVTVLVSFGLVPHIGYLGFAIAFACSGLVMMTLCYFLGQKYYPVPYDIKSAVGYMVLGGSVIALSSLFHFKHLGISVAIHMGIIIVLLALTYWKERDALPAKLKR
ncbi:O-antigen/teichoic acid export membrane protein [Dyadobacter jejuensis]|uniref:O-antigen/teichoic acid export membrane protein n=1 Tax=Dyadobacter jejuensis TaxID=1082580 RepID=A0A316ARE3_9BACT|nr:polysaccharide biosynthesis C-terminal domain-containing protein [Dyadobacter jejuensis]PWJ59869.1 O-antigen/teichoic acid export membrane protein [Dyadobacter jejuensis]